MKDVYLTLLKKNEEMYVAYIPDFDINTEGYDLYDAICMVRDAIGLTGITLKDDGKPIPVSSTNIDISKYDYDIITYVDIDFDEYQKRFDRKLIKKTINIPNYLNTLAEKEGINFSRLLTDTLKEKFSIEN